jgi:hypothetical protein
VPTVTTVVPGIEWNLRVDRDRDSGGLRPGPQEAGFTPHDRCPPGALTGGIESMPPFATDDVGSPGEADQASSRACGA